MLWIVNSKVLKQMFIPLAILCMCHTILKILHLAELSVNFNGFENGIKKKGSIWIVVSGNRPFEFMKSQEIRFKNFSEKAKKQGYLLRFWSTPNHTAEQRIAVWTELKNAGVGLIGADELKELQGFFILKQ